MILFLDEDRAYIHWVTHHRTGFVLDCLRNPTKAHLVVHRATCPEVKHAASKRTHWTTGRHMKGCSLDLEELKTWVKEQTDGEPAYCPTCTPDQEVELGVPHLTKLDRDILSYVLEIAAYHLDDDDYAYGLTVGMVGRCLGKTEGQLTAAFTRLVQDGLLTISGKMKPGAALSSAGRVYPTAKALRTLPAFAELSDEQIESQLRELGKDQS